MSRFYSSPCIVVLLTLLLVFVKMFAVVLQKLVYALFWSVDRPSKALLH